MLACGPDAMLSHRDGGALWQLMPVGAGAIDVTVPRTVTGRPGIRVHRVRALHPEDWTIREGIPVTTVARTLLDLAEVLHPGRLERVFEQAERLELLDLREIERLLARSRGRHGLRPLRELLDREQPVIAGEARSELERRFLDLCRSAGLPAPAVNVSVAGFEVDAYWPNARVVVELDGYAYHRSRSAFERDRERDTALTAAGHRVVRLTDRRLRREHERIVGQLRSLLAHS